MVQSIGPRSARNAMRSRAARNMPHFAEMALISVNRAGGDLALNS
jgi:hypothetical protein